MESRGWWNNDAETELKARLKADVMQAFKRAETMKRAELGELFTDVYGGQEPWNIVSPFLQLLLPSIVELCDTDAPLPTEGAKGGTEPTCQEIRHHLGTLAKGAEQVQKQWSGSHAAVMDLS